MPESAKERIGRDEWVECAICRDAFRRQRMTKRYCHKCDKGFCEGEHGNFSRGVGTCVICGASKPTSDALPKIRAVKGPR